MGIFPFWAVFLLGIILMITLIYCGSLFIYTLPYLAWIGWNSGTKGIPKKLESENLPAGEALKLHRKNATKLYRSWITKEPHGITKF